MMADNARQRGQDRVYPLPGWMTVTAGQRSGGQFLFLIKRITLEAETSVKFEQWSIVEVMGRLSLAGLTSEQTIAGQGFIRVDVPAVDGRGGFTRFFGPGSIYSITPVDEDIARRFVARNFAAPVQPWQIALPTPRDESSEDTDGDEEENPRAFPRSDDAPF